MDSGSNAKLAFWDKNRQTPGTLLHFMNGMTFKVNFLPQKTSAYFFFLKGCPILTARRCVYSEDT